MPVTLENEGSAPVKCRTVDVSEGGALLSVEESLPLGNEFKIRFKVDRFELGPEKVRVLRNDSAFGGTELLTAVEFTEPHRGLTKMMEFEREKKAWQARHLQALTGACG